MERKIVNPVTHETVTYVATAAETGGQYSDNELTLPAGGGIRPHFHRQFAERFTAIEGTLGLEIDGRRVLLRPGQTCAVPVGAVHRFFNPGTPTIRFRLRLIPGQEGVENTVRIQYGLAQDGRTNRNGAPRNPLLLALLFEMSGTYVPVLHTVLAPLMNGLAGWARRRGLDRQLLNTYCR